MDVRENRYGVIAYRYGRGKLSPSLCDGCYADGETWKVYFRRGETLNCIESGWCHSCNCGFDYTGTNV